MYVLEVAVYERVISLDPDDAATQPLGILDQHGTCDLPILTESISINTESAASNENLLKRVDT